MSRVNTLEKLKQKVNQLQQDKDRAQGRLEAAQKQLKDEFDVDSLGEAEKLLKKLSRKEQESKEEFDQALEAFNEEWKDKLDD